jgi:hypothetical protein
VKLLNALDSVAEKVGCYKVSASFTSLSIHLFCVSDSVDRIFWIVRRGISGSIRSVDMERLDRRCTAISTKKLRSEECRILFDSHVGVWVVVAPGWVWNNDHQLACPHFTCRPPKFHLTPPKLGPRLTKR